MMVWAKKCREREEAGGVEQRQPSPRPTVSSLAPQTSTRHDHGVRFLRKRGRVGSTAKCSLNNFVSNFQAFFKEERFLVVTCWLVELIGCSSIETLLFFTYSECNATVVQNVVV